MAVASSPRVLRGNAAWGAPSRTSFPATSRGAAGTAATVASDGRKRIQQPAIWCSKPRRTGIAELRWPCGSASLRLRRVAAPRAARPNSSRGYVRDGNDAAGHAYRRNGDSAAGAAGYRNGSNGAGVAGLHRWQRQRCRRRRLQGRQQRRRRSRLSRRKRQHPCRRGCTSPAAAPGSVRGSGYYYGGAITATALTKDMIMAATTTRTIITTGRTAITIITGIRAAINAVLTASTTAAIIAGAVTGGRRRRRDRQRKESSKRTAAQRRPPPATVVWPMAPQPVPSAVRSEARSRRPSTMTIADDRPPKPSRAVAGCCLIRPARTP